MKIQVYLTKECGLEVFKVYVNNTLHSSWWSRELAMVAVQKLKMRLS